MDRDTYVKVHFNNIIDKATSNFRKCDENNPKELCVLSKTKYDFQSIMHYRATSLGKEPCSRGTADCLDGKKVTLSPKVSVPFNLRCSGKPCQFGQRINLSDLDVDDINNLYDCKTGKCILNVIGV